MMEKFKAAGRVFVIGLVLVAGLFIVGTFINVYTGVIAESVGMSRSLLSISSTLRCLVSFALNLVIYRLIKRFGLRRLVLIGVAAAAAMIFIYSVSTSLVLFYIAGIIGGLSSCFAGVVPVSIMIRHYFPKSQGTALAIASSMTGVAGIVVTPLISKIVSVSSWQSGFRYLGIGVIAMLILEVLFFDDSKLDYKSIPERKRASKKAKKSSSFVLMVALSGLFTLGGLCVYNNTAVIVQDLGFEQLFATGTAVSLVSFANIFGKFLMGRLCDRRNMKVVLTIWYVLCVAAALYFAIYRGTTLAIALPGIFIMGFIGGIYSLPIPLLAGKLYKNEEAYTRAVGYCTAAQNMCWAFSSVVFQMFYDVTGTYVVSLLYVAVLASISVVCLVVLFKGMANDGTKTSKGV